MRLVTGKQATWLDNNIPDLGAATVDLSAKLTATPAATSAAIPASTNITTVPETFADVAAVQTYLASANVVPNIESRLDALEAKVNDILSKLKAAGIMVS